MLTRVRTNLTAATDQEPMRGNAWPSFHPITVGSMFDPHSLERFEALPEPRDWLGVALANISDGVITANAAGRITYLNPVAERLTAWTKADATGQSLDTVFQIIHQTTRLTAENPAVRALREGILVGPADHSLLISRTGVECAIENSAVPIRGATGDVVGILLVFRDVTERRAQNQAMRDSLVYAQNIIATLGQPFLVLDKTLRVRTANQSFYRDFQVASEETEGRFIYDLGNRQWDIPRLRELLEDVLPDDHSLQGFVVECDFSTIGRRTVRLNARRVLQEGGHSELILLAIEDITDRRRADTMLCDSELRYRRLFETAQDAILIVDARTGAITDANPFVAHLLDYSRVELIGKALWQIGVFKDQAASRAAFEELQAKRNIRYDHLPLQTKAGRRVDVEFVSNVYEVDHTSVIQCNIRDITERICLERQVAEQAGALADLNRRKDEFLAMLSHELRNPIAPIANAVQLLRLQKANENAIQEQARAIIERQLGQLSHLVNDLLEVSRIVTGRVRLRLEEIVIEGVVNQSVEAVRPLIEQRHHQLTVSLPPEPIWLNADVVRLEQIIVNLLNNAAKYTDEQGQIWLTITTEGNEMVLRVRDTGVGITPELLPHIFELFTQGRRSLDRSQGGLGIGLALVDRLVEMHEGTIEVHSMLGRGSEFIVRLPMLSTHHSPPVPLGNEAAETLERALRVLVVDDNVDAARSLALLLKFSGHYTRVAHSGAAALEVARVFQPNVVILDIGLPGMDGHETAQRIRRLPGLDHVVLIAMTGYGQETDRQRSRDAGFDHHLVKPPDMQTVREILAAIEPAQLPVV